MEIGWGRWSDSQPDSEIRSAVVVSRHTRACRSRTWIPAVVTIAGVGPCTSSHTDTIDV
jgi:hypothetical protein